MSANQYSENLFTAVEVITNSIINKQGFDKTIICTITDNTNRREGKYIVSNGSTEFEAYSEITTYKNNTQVYVLIPNNDFKQQKKITGKYMNNNDLSYVQSSPFDNLIDITGNMLNGVISQGLLANNPESKEILLQTVVCGNGVQNYTIIGLSAEFATKLEGLNVRFGEYGLRLQINGEYINGEQVKRNFYLKSSDMYGDIYNFTNYFKQEIFFKIPNEFNKINSLSLYFYQNNNFKDKNNNLIPYMDSFGGLYLNNLFIKDPYLFLGYANEDIKDGGVFIYTFNGESYIEDGQNNKKKIYLRWLRKDDNGIIKSIESLEENQIINWYQYNLEEGLIDNLAGAFWKQISSNTFEYELSPNVNLATESIKVIIKDKDEIFYSNILDFYNEKEVPNQATVDLIQGLEILCEGDTLGGIFRLYGEDGVLVNKSEADKKRYFKANYTLVENGKGDNFGDGESITWIFPKNNTMIQAPLEGREYILDNGDIFKESDNEYTITRLRKDNKLNIEQPYRIKYYFTPNYYNNEIKCIVVKNNREYKSSRLLTFAQTGTFGTDYTLVLSFQNGINALPIKGRASVYAKLYDGNNKEVNLEGKEVNWGWHFTDDRITLIDTNTFQCELIIKETSINTSGTSNILKATILIDGISLSAFLPIPISLDLNTYNRLEGPTTIIYNYKGDDYSYIRLPYKLYDKENNEITISNWNLNFKSIENSKFFPQLDGYYLTPQNLFISNVDYNIVVNGFIDDGTLVWQQPIYIGQNRYPSAMLNEWDGKLTIDEKNGTILSMMMGAGRKETDNSFSGVLMGDIQTSTEGGITDSIGLYGYHHGAQSFGFKVDGTAFIGKSNTGRIEFDGIKGTITSREYKESGNGTILDFDDGYLLLKGKEIDGKSSSVKLSESSPYLEIKDQKEKTLIKIDDETNGYYLQSSDFDNSKLTGTKISLNDGKIISYNFDLQAKNENGGLFIKSTDPYLEIKNNNGNSLLYIGETDYYLQSGNFSSDKKNGTKIDIDDGKIESYNFNLQTSNVKISSNEEAYFMINGSNENDLLVKMGKSDLFLQSNDFSSANKKGMKIDIFNGTIHAYKDFVLEATGSTSHIALNPNASNYGIEIYDAKNNLGTHLGVSGILIGVGGTSFSTAPISLGTNGIIHLNTTQDIGSAIIINGQTLKSYIQSLIPAIPSMPDLSSYVTITQLQNHHHSLYVQAGTNRGATDGTYLT